MNIPERTSLSKFKLSTEIMSYDQVSVFVNDSISSTNLSDLNGNIDKSKIENFGSYLSSSSRLSDINDNEIANYLTREDLPDVAKLIVTAVTKDGAVVSGQTVKIYAGKDQTYPVFYSKPYEGTPVVFKVTQGMEYFVAITDNLPFHFNPSTSYGFAHSDTNITLEYQDVNNIDTFKGLQSALSTFSDVEQARKTFVGLIMDDVWIDYDKQENGDAKTRSDAGQTKHAKYASNMDENNHPIWYDPFVITDVRQVEDADGNVHDIAAVLMRVYGSVYDNVYDAPNHEIATETVQQEGIKYCVLSGGTRYWLSAGEPIPQGESITVYKNIYKDNNMIDYGHNSYKHSAIRQYVNSNADKGEWWSNTEEFPKHVGQVAPSRSKSGSVNAICGYMRGCSTDLLETIKPTKQICMQYSGPNEVVCDKFFLPSILEMFGDVTANPQEGNSQYTFWKKLTGRDDAQPSNNSDYVNVVRKCKKTTAKDKTNYEEVLLRSARRSHLFMTWKIAATGAIGIGQASQSIMITPACVIY